MNCARMGKVLVDYSEGVLSEAGRASVARHLSHCEGCSLSLKQIEEVKRQVALTEVPVKGPEFWEAFDKKLFLRLEESAPAVCRRPLQVGLPFVAAAAAMMVVAFIAILRLMTFSGGVEPVQRVADLSPGIPQEQPAGVTGFETDFFSESGDNEVIFASTDYSSVELERLEGDMLALLAENLQAISDDMIDGGIYERSIYDFDEEQFEGLLFGEI